MFIHIFALRWKPETTEADIARATKEILAFQGVIPGLIEMQVGANVSPRGKGYAYIGVMKFTSKEATEAYFVHPIHVALLEWLLPLVDGVELDLEA
jgi:Stress responsive A/B Barrel Domain